MYNQCSVLKIVCIIFKQGYTENKIYIYGMGVFVEFN